MNSTGDVRSGKMSAIIRSVSSERRDSFSISVVSRAELSGCAPWTLTFADQRKDYRYYEILDDTLRGHFKDRYFAIIDRRPLRKYRTSITAARCSVEAHARSSSYLVDEALRPLGRASVRLRNNRPARQGDRWPALRRRLSDDLAWHVDRQDHARRRMNTPRPAWPMAR